MGGLPGPLVTAPTFQRAYIAQSPVFQTGRGVNEGGNPSALTEHQLAYVPMHRTRQYTDPAP